MALKSDARQLRFCGVPHLFQRGIERLTVFAIYTHPDVMVVHSAADVAQCLIDAEMNAKRRQEFDLQIR